MKTVSPIRIWAVCLLLSAAVSGVAAGRAVAQTDQTATVQLLGKAHALEVRGRMDMAKQTWQQVLLVDPNNSEALSGMARAAKLEGNNKDAAAYLDKMRALNPADPNIARVEGMSSQMNTSAQLQEAGKLAQAGQYARAMTILRSVYGDNPPAGDGALSYYQTEAATEDGRPHAIAGLRALVDKYPQDSRYQIALGKILTYNPRTRAEGRKLLEKHPSNPEASEALRQSLVWDAQNPATSADIRNYLAHHKDQQLSTALATTAAQAAASRRSSYSGPRAPALTPEQVAAQTAFRERSAEDNAAYASLNAKRIDEAEGRFKAIVAKNPTDTQALAGLGYVRMQQANFGGAISYLEQAQNDGSKDPGVDKALRDSRFYYTMQEATAALNENDLVTAQRQFQAALTMRQNDPEALLGLGGTLLKAQQPEPAVSVFTTFVRVKSMDKAAWRGLFMANYGAGRYQEALAVDKRVPASLHGQLMRDPDYLRTLASVYSALGRDADAQRVLRSALELPFPAGGKGLKADTQLQYAALLSAANHKEQAAGLYRQVLADDNTNSNAWAGLVQTQHALGMDADAYQSLQTMPQASLAAAMVEPGFDTTVAAIYMSQGKFDLAQSVDEQILARERQEGKKPFVPAQVQLAGLYLQRGNAQQAYPLYREILTNNPGRADAWEGLLSALHSTGHDQEAVAQLQAIPPDVRRNLENDPAYLQTVGSIYAGVGQPREAAVLLARVRQHYVNERVAVPADVDIQGAWLLYNSQNDAALYPALMALGGRTDLTDQQRRTVQQIWANFAVRRADAAAAAGNQRRSLAILNAAAQSFPDNPAVAKALASGYAAAGLPKKAVAILRAQDLSAGSPGDYRAAVGAALADNDLKDAEIWLRFGLNQYPRDPQLLNMAGKFEQARGDAGRAAEYYKASLANMPPEDPGVELSGELSRLPVQPVRRAAAPVATQPMGLADLLAAPDTAMDRSGVPQQVVQRPYLPGSRDAVYSGAPVVLGGGNAGYRNGGASMGSGYGAGTSGYSGQNMMGQSVNGYAAPMSATPTYAMPMNGMPMSAAPANGMSGMPMDAGEGASSMYANPAYANATTSGMSHGMAAQGSGMSGYGTPDMGGPPMATSPNYDAMPATKSKRRKTTPVPAGTLKDYMPQSRLDAPAGVLHLHPNATTEMLYGPYVSYDPSMETPVMAAGASAWTVQRGLHQAAFQQNAIPAATPQTTADGTPIVPYAAVARPAAPRAQHQRTPSEAARQRAAAIHANQSAAPVTMTGVSHPPTENYDAQVQPAQYTSQPAGTMQQGGQTTQPQGGMQTDQQSGTSSSLPANAPTQMTTQSPAQMPTQNGESYGQQYPQPNTRGTTPVTRTRRRAKAAPEPAPVQAPIQYPTYAPQPLSNPGPVLVGPAYPLPPAPTDRDLQQRNIPPLRGYFDPRIDPRIPLTERQQEEFDLAQLEGSYSGWLGGSVIGRYRSGTPGIDRLTSLEVPFEASGVIGKSLRITVIPRAVFLNSGTLATGTAAAGTNPILGTLPGNATVAPQQQFANGIGGEVQAVTNTFAVALGVTPYQFLVMNVIGRARWRPGNGHFTFYGGRDAVKETQLSYAGLRDPGSATTTFGGNVWGGVVETGAGVRFDSGNEKSGFYIQGEGAALTGYHVLDNRKYDGTMGAYFRVKVWPEYGSLNVGGTIFGEHYDHNERGETYGLGGYFSPEAYFLAAIPVTFNGHYGTDFHYVINGSAGIQTFQEDNQIYFPLDPAIQATYTIGCTTVTNPNCGQSTVNSNTGLNYSIDAQGSYRVSEHWYVGGFLTGNNTNNYNTISGGFFARYLFRPQYSTTEYPTGLFPIEGFRPLRVP